MQQAVPSVGGSVIRRVRGAHPIPQPMSPSPPHCLVGYRMTSRRLLHRSVSRDRFETYSKSALYTNSRTGLST